MQRNFIPAVGPFFDFCFRLIAKKVDCLLHCLMKCDIIKIRIELYGGIAQLVRALASHARGRRFKSYCLYHVGTDFALFRFFFAEKIVTRAVVPPLSQKGTLGSTAHLQARSQRFAVATTFLRGASGTNISIVWLSHVGASYILLAPIFFTAKIRRISLKTFTFKIVRQIICLQAVFLFPQAHFLFL